MAAVFQSAIVTDAVKSGSIGKSICYNQSKSSKHDSTARNASMSTCRFMRFNRSFGLKTSQKTGLCRLECNKIFQIVKAIEQQASENSESSDSNAETLRKSAESLKEKAELLRSQAHKASGQFMRAAGVTAENLLTESEKLSVLIKAESERAKQELDVKAVEAAASLAESAHEAAERAKEELSKLKEGAPDSIKEIAEVAIESHSKEKASKGAVIHDFCLGIPYGGLLFAGGLIWFLVSGSLHALRFGTLLGAALLAASVQSLRVWKQGKSTTRLILGQAVIAFIITVKEFARYSTTKCLFPTLATAIVSALMTGFYVYVILAGGPPLKKSSLNGSAITE